MIEWGLPTSVRLSAADRPRLDVAAERAGTTVTEFVRAATVAAIDLVLQKDRADRVGARSAR